MIEIIATFLQSIVNLIGTAFAGLAGLISGK